VEIPRPVPPSFILLVVGLPARVPADGRRVESERARRDHRQGSEGRTNRQIGEAMFLAEKTVKNYVSHLLTKLGMSSRTEAAVYAARLAERRKGEGRDVQR
jgi:DNA-binding NarL/FixJ family response regulator